MTAAPSLISSRLIVGVSGASGAAYAVTLLEALRPLPVETHLVVSRAGVRTLVEETGLKLVDLQRLADVSWPVDDIGAAIASGSFRTLGMVVVPCSIRTLSEIACGTTQSLLTRAADVTLKERRRLVLMVRETPLHTGHLKTMLAASEMGAIIAPPVPAMYAKPETVADMVGQTVGRILDLFDLDAGLVRRWGEAEKPPPA